MQRQRFEVVWTEPAIADFKAVLEYIRRRNPLRVRELSREWKKRITALCRQPNKGRLVPETMAIGLEVYRELLLNPYRVVYRVRGAAVYIMGFLDGRRDLEELLFERLTK